MLPPPVLDARTKTGPATLAKRLEEANMIIKQAYIEVGWTVMKFASVLGGFGLIGLIGLGVVESSYWLPVLRRQLHSFFILNC